MGIEHWMPRMKALLGEIAGLDGNVRGYDDLPGGLLELPCLIVLPRAGTPRVQNGSGLVIWRHQVTASLYLAPGLLPEAMSQAVPFIQRVHAKVLANVQLGGLSWSGGSVAHWLPAPDVEFYEGPGRLTYGRVEGADLEYTGIIFRMELKETQTGAPVST
jgi:hypothetical protein